MIGGNCQNNIDNCKYYSSQTIDETINYCHQCNANYYLTNDDKTCSEIPQQYVLYMNSDIDYKCQDGYYLSSEMKCTPCPSTDDN